MKVNSLFIAYSH